MFNLNNELSQIIEASIYSVSPKFFFEEKIRISESKIITPNFEINLNEFEKIFVIGFGKASSAMATELEKHLINRITDGVVITKYGFKTITRKIKVYEAAHPIPDENSLVYSQEIINLLSKASENDLVLCLISGGGSALFEVLEDGITLNQLILLNETLIKLDIPISKINFYRKAFSKVKGGKLLRYTFPATCLSFIISDVVNDDLSVIASGPTYINQTQSAPYLKSNARISEFSNIYDDIEKLDEFIYQKEFESQVLEYFNKRVFNVIVASNRDAVDAAVKKIYQSGYEIDLVQYNLSDTVENVSKLILNQFDKFSNTQIKFKKSIVLGGETFLKVKGTGKGGRNTHLTLLVLNELIDKKLNFKFLFTSFSTDGNDGPTDCAGAFLNNQILQEVKNSKIDLEYYLKNFDSYNFFQNFNCLIKSGPTYTNVADLIICLFEN
ncbi:MAG: DUF4147 domain-containing protein [Ignavibacteria bacterium]|nr:DUF4147 domain-containing protein [Ignavibacteria bacterium]